MNIKIIFDKERSNNKLEAGWGIAYLIDNKVLFDTAEKADYLLHNLKILDIDINKIKTIIISHNRFNHRGGLWKLLEIKNEMQVIACPDFLEEFSEKIKEYNFKEAKDFAEVAKGIYSTGCFSFRYHGKSMYEQALIIKTNKGISLVCACAHPGILEMIHRAKSLFPHDAVYCIIGGLHLLDKDKRFIKYLLDEIKKAGIKKIGVGHCTGFVAVSLFKEAFGSNCFEIKSGVEYEP